MKRATVTVAACCVCLTAVIAPAAWAGAVEDAPVADAGGWGWPSLLPPLLAICLALVTRQVIVSLLLGIFCGTMLQAGGNPLVAFMRLGDQYLAGALGDADHAAMVLFTTVLGGMVGILGRTGATAGIVSGMSRIVSGRRGGQIGTAAMGSAIFFDDYANTLLVGNTMRPLTDRLRISREKLAYLVDSTAAPVVTIAVISTWVGFEVGLIQDAMAAVGESGAYSFFLRTIPYGFYPILTIVFVYLIAGTGRDFGPMLEAESRAGRDGLVLREGARPAADVAETCGAGDENDALPLAVAALPIVLVIVVTAVGLWWDGRGALLAAGITEYSLREILNEANSFAVLIWAALAGAMTAGVIATASRRLTLQDAVSGWVDGARAMLIAIVILVLAWSLSAVCDALGTAPYLVDLCQDALSARLLPAVTFLLAAVVSFATGTSWGTMGILMPLVYPLGAQLPIGEGLAPAVAEGIHLAATGAILAGAVFGDHCSPISDTTIMSSLASGSDHVDHVRTQLPYAMTVGGVAIVTGYLPVGFGMPPWIGLAVGVVLLALLVWRLGRRPEYRPGGTP